MNVTIRPATPDDARAIAAVHVASWRNLYRGIVSDAVLDQLSVRRRAEHWRSQLGQPMSHDVTFVAVDEDHEVIGFANGGAERENDPEFTGELFAIYLLEETQRQGIGRKLTRSVFDALNHDGMQNVLIWVLVSNPACGFFEALGAQPVRDRIIDIDGKEHKEIGFGWSASR